MNNIGRISIKMKRDARTSLNTLLQRGFYLRASGGKTVRAFLNEVFEYDDEFINKDVRTVFLNNSPVDDIDRKHVNDGDRLAMGAAMPGLVGIVMGRDNPYKSFRSDIDCQADQAMAGSQESIRVFVKIFSSLAVQTGEDILRRGIEVDVGVLANFLKEKRESVVAGPSIDDLPQEGDVRITIEVV